MPGPREQTELRAALEAGARRAAVHVVRAGFEIAAAGGALLDELIRVRRDAPEGEAADRRGPAKPTRIEVE